MIFMRVETSTPSAGSDIGRRAGSPVRKASASVAVVFPGVVGLHFVLAVGMILLGIHLGRRRPTPQVMGSPPGERRSASPDEIDLAPIFGGSR